MVAHASSVTRKSPRWWHRFVVMSRRWNGILLIEILAVLAFATMVALTYLAFAQAPAEDQLLPAGQVSTLLIGTLIPSMTLLVLLGRRLALRRAAGSTARLHVRLVFFFSIVAAVPTLLVAAFSAILFQSGIDFWFSGSSRDLMANANSLAEGYYQTNQLQVARETETMAGDMRFYLERGEISDPGFADFYSLQMQGRDLNESAILQEMPDGSFRTAAAYDLVAENQPANFAASRNAELAETERVIVNANETRIEALAPIASESGVYLYNARHPASRAFNQWANAKAVVAGYTVLTNSARDLQLRFNLALYVMSLALVGLAVWFALKFADRQVEPLTDLVMAARKVGAGNFAMRIEGRTGADEIGLLNRAFNRMTAQIEKQTDALVSANSQMDRRRAFMEALLESVSAGIVSIDNDGCVLLLNSSAQNILLDADKTAGPGTPLTEVEPQIAALAEAGLKSGIVTVNRDGELLTLAVEIASTPDGKVITFEDITRQLLDQRQAAWSDVARRIAHEIKNPLTPIQLATERLQRRYRKQIESDGELFDDLTGTIIRQVGDLRKMVDEFSSFARLPKPVFRQEDALDLIRQALFLQEVANPHVNFGLDADLEDHPQIYCDRHQFGQALTNVLKNAIEAVDARALEEGEQFRGRIEVEAHCADEFLLVSIEDNGVGLPQERDRIVEPYVTTRDKGTGLGLAIVNKIVEEHGGDMVFASTRSGGTRVTLRFALSPEPQNSKAQQ